MAGMIGNKMNTGGGVGVMDELKIPQHCVETLLDKKFVRVFDLQYAEGRHYFDATRRRKEDLVATMTEEQFTHMLPDAVSCVVILEMKGSEPLLLLDREYRYPVGRYVLSIPAGLIDEEEKDGADPVLSAAEREIFEETGLRLQQGDRISLINPLLFSTPGMTDESNALVCAVIRVDDLSALRQDGAVGGEMFDGFCLTTLEQAKTYLASGRDAYGRSYSIFTWAALMWFVSGMWKKA